MIIKWDWEKQNDFILRILIFNYEDDRPLVSFYFSYLSVNFLYAQHEMLDTAAFQKIRIAELNSSQIPRLRII